MPGNDMRYVSEEQLRQLRDKLPAVTGDHLFAVYGISETTWRRMRHGGPIRASTFERIMARYARLEP